MHLVDLSTARTAPASANEPGAPGRDAGGRSLAARVHRGDRGAFEDLMERYGARLLRLALRRLASVEDARDAVQETFLRAWRSRRSLDPSRPLEPWLVTIAVNVCRTAGRRSERAGEASFEALREAGDPEPADGAPGPQRRAEASQRARAVAEALRELPEQERRTLELRDIQGLTTGQVAELLGITGATVRSHLSRARLKIRRRLGERTDREAPAAPRSDQKGRTP